MLNPIAQDLVFQREGSGFRHAHLRIQGPHGQQVLVAPPVTHLARIKAGHGPGHAPHTYLAGQLGIDPAGATGMEEGGGGRRHSRAGK